MDVVILVLSLLTNYMMVDDGRFHGESLYVCGLIKSQKVKTKN